MGAGYWCAAGAQRAVRAILVLASLSHAAAGEPGLARWALLASRAVQEAGLSDLLFAKMAAADGLELIERERLATVSEEHRLAAMGLAGGSQRVRIGQLLKADALLLVSLEGTAEQRCVKLVISDSRHGARIRMEYLPYQAGQAARAIEQALAAVSQVRQHFRKGIRHLIGVSHFASKNLTHDYDNLQAGYAYLLANALAAFPGVATIETEEARAIRDEVTLAGDGTVGRVVPLLVEGDFLVERGATPGRPTVAFDIRLNARGAKPRTLRPQPMPLGEAAAYLTRKLPGDILAEASAAATAFSDDEQRAWLVARANSFSQVGAWEHAVGLREAALLLKSDDVPQRLQAVSEYRRLMIRPYEELRGIGWQPNHPVARAAIQRRLDAYLAALSHLEYLIRNRQVPALRAAELAGQFSTKGFLHSIGSSAFEVAEEAEARFTQEVLPLVLSLPKDDVPQHQFGEAYFLTVWQRAVLDAALTRRDRTHRTKADLDSIRHVLTDVIPDHLSTSQEVEQFLCYGEYRDERAPHPSGGFTDEEWVAFLNALKASSREIPRIYGRYGLVRWQWNHRRGKPREELQALLAEVQALLADFAAAKYSPPSNESRTREWIYSRLSDLRGYLSREVGPTTVTSRPGPTKSVRPPGWEDDPEMWKKFGYPETMGRLRFEAVELRRRTANGKTERFGGTEHLRKCGERLDALWSYTAVYLMREPKVAEQVYAGKWVSDVQWDGRSVWIATQDDGIRVLAPSGKELQQIGPAQGLPASDRGLLLHPMAPGKVCAIGSLGEHRRGWCAIVTGGTQAAAVNVFHQATKVPKELYGLKGAPPEMVFRPGWVHAYDGGEGSPPMLLVGRDAPSVEAKHHPLLIDLEKLTVSVFPVELRFGDMQPSHSYFSRNGELLEASEFSVVHHAAPGKTLEGGQARRELCENETRTGMLRHCLLLHDGWLYAPGSRWYRIDPQSFQEERLVPARLPLKYSMRNFAVSAHYGLLAWGSNAVGDGGAIYRVTIAPK